MPAASEVEDELAPRPVGRSEAKLECTAGPRAGTEFPLSGDDEIVIGRATENVISIPDTSVSRRHCSVRRVETGWVISDLGSGNGTVVNGEEIEEETLLGNGDHIIIGDTELTFHDVANATDRRPMPMPVRRNSLSRGAAVGRPDVRARLARAGAPTMDPAKKRKLLLMGGGVLVLIVGGLVSMKLVAMKQQASLQAQQLAEQQRRGELSALFQEGMNLARNGDWTEAKVKFDELLELSPNYPMVKDYANQANVEIPNQQYLADAAAALEANQISAAAEALKKVQEPTSQFEKLREVKAKLDAKLSTRLTEVNRIVASLDRRAAKDVQRASWVKVQEITDDILKMNPDHRDAKIQNETAKSNIAALDYVAPSVAPVRQAAWVPVVSRYTDGDMTGALSMAEACAGADRKCKGLVADIREFATLYKKVETLDAKGLAKLLSLDRSITNGGLSKMGRTAGTRAANLFYKNASQAKAIGQWGKAADWADKALKADPDHSPSRAIRDEVRTRAKDEYLRCYSMKDSAPDDAVLCFKDVLKMTSPGDDNHEKSKSWIEKLDR